MEKKEGMREVDKDIRYQELESGSGSMKKWQMGSQLKSRSLASLGMTK